MLSCQILFPATCLLPVLAYPFLPSVGRSRLRCEALLVWNAVVLAAFLTVNRVIFRWQVELWPLIVMHMYGLAGFRALRVPWSRELKAEDLVCTAEHVVTWMFWGYLDLVMDTIEARESGWMALASLQFLGGFVVGYVARLAAGCYLSQALLHFVTRRVSWWRWLPEDGSDNEFGPCWSMFLAVNCTFNCQGLAPNAHSFPSLRRSSAQLRRQA